MKKVVLFLVGGLMMMSCGEKEMTPEQVELQKVTQQIQKYEIEKDSILSILSPMYNEHMAFQDSVIENDLDIFSDGLSEMEMEMALKMEPYEIQYNLTKSRIVSLKKEQERLALLATSMK